MTLAVIERPHIGSCKQEPARQAAAGQRAHISLFIDDLGGGGVQRMALTLGRALAERNHRVDLVICRAAGPLAALVPTTVTRVGLKPAPQLIARAMSFAADPKGFGLTLRPINLRWKPPRDLVYLPALVRYLRSERPDVLLAATPYLNLAAVWAKRLAKVPTRVVVSERNNVSFRIRHKRKQRALPPLIRRAYMMADGIIAVSNGVAEDLAAVTSIPRDRITTIYNPVVTEDLTLKAGQPLDHPWFRSGEPPVVLGAGLLSERKDFPTLLRAFARVRAQREARLVILGDAKDAAKSAVRRSDLSQQAAQLGVLEHLALPGFVDNPYAYMAKASVFTLSSAWEGFGNVLVEALACGCPVVSSDCPSGPAEILDNGRFGRLVPVGDDAALATSILATLDAPPNQHLLKSRAGLFSIERAVDRYLDVMRCPSSRHEPMQPAAMADELETRFGRFLG